MERPNRSIVLIGFMGTGKSSVGRLLATDYGWPRYDTDELIADSFELSVPEIFEEYGEERFRDEESALLARLEGGEPSIVVTGGGIVLRPENVARLRELGTVVCLTADLATLQERLQRRKNRPLLQSGDLSETVPRLLQEREPFYEEAADFSVDTSALTHKQVAQSIRDLLALAA